MTFSLNDLLISCGAVSKDMPVSILVEHMCSSIDKGVVENINAFCESAGYSDNIAYTPMQFAEVTHVILTIESCVSSEIACLMHAVAVERKWEVCFCG